MFLGHTFFEDTSEMEEEELFLPLPPILIRLVANNSHEQSVYDNLRRNIMQSARLTFGERTPLYMRVYAVINDLLHYSIDNFDFLTNLDQNLDQNLANHENLLIILDEYEARLAEDSDILSDYDDDDDVDFYLN